MTGFTILAVSGVPVVVEPDRAAAYPADGLLGLSFRSRFNVITRGSGTARSAVEGAPDA